LRSAPLDALATQLEDGVAAPLDGSADAASPSDPPAIPKPRSKPKGRRDLGAEKMPEERVELLNPALEGVVERIGFEESFTLGYRRGGRVRLVLARATYKSRPVPGADRREEEPAFKIITVPMPKMMFPRGLLAPSMIEEAKRHAFCLSTDATGVCIQPEPLASRQRQACRKGHFFVVLADRDHVFFEYQPKHTSAAVCEMFRGFSGYIQADAHAIYDAVFRGEARVCDDDAPPKEVGCWSHCRRKAWEAAVVAKDPAAREALLRMRALFELEEQWADLAPAQRHARRQLASRPLVDDFFAWAAAQYARVKDVRGLVATAFGYAVRQEAALRRFLVDGRLPMTNNHSERALRTVAVGRKAWLFFGSDDHANAAANLLSLIASCELHGIDPEAYLLDIIHVLPYWPRGRYLELAPKYWTATRARIPERELAVEIGDITVPPPLPPQEQSASR